MQTAARLVGVACLLGSLAAAFAAEPMPELKADRLLINGAAVRFQPFTMEEFQAAQAQLSGASSKPITPDTVITVGNGLKTTVADYLNRLNALEQGFTQMGVTLRTETPQPLAIQETDIPAAPDDSNTTQGGASGEVSAFVPFDWSKTFGKQDSVAVTVHAWLDANSGPNAVTSDVLTEVTALLAGQPLPIFKSHAEGSLPVPLSAMDRRYATSGYGFLGNETPSWLYAAPDTTSLVQTALDIPITPEPSVTFHGLLGPIPVSVTLGVRGEVSIAATAQTDSAWADANVGPSIAAKVFGSLLMDVGIVTAGAEGEADLARFTPALDSKVSAVEHPGANTELAWNYGFTAGFSSGSGEIDLVATVDLWILGKRQFVWKLLTLPGVDYQGFQTGAQQTLARAPLSPMPTVWKHVEERPLGGFIGAGMKTFGGACPAGTTRVECRAYPLRDDVVDCSLAHFTSESPTDCTCQFHVGSAAFKSAQCGADIWIAQP